jgi:hypothetical protein
MTPVSSQILEEPSAKAMFQGGVLRKFRWILGTKETTWTSSFQGRGWEAKIKLEDILERFI